MEKLPLVDEAGPAARPDHRQGLHQEREVPAAPPRTRPGGWWSGPRSGVGEDAKSRAQALVEAGVDFLVVDTAHGHAQAVLEMIGQVKANSGSR